MGAFTPSRQNVPGTTTAGTDASDRHEFTGSIVVSGSGFVNFGQVSGSTGYGFRSEDGTLQFKNAGGAWDTFGSAEGAVTAYTNTGNDRIITSDGDTGINGEANLTFNGSTLVVEGDVSSSANISASLYYGDGSNLTGIAGAAAITSYTNPANNRLITSVDSDTVNAEANLTFDGTSLLIDGQLSASANISASAFVGDIIYLGGAANDTSIEYVATDNIEIKAGGNTALYIKNDGYVGIGTDSDISYGVTLPNTSSPAGKVQATAFITYSSSRYKSNIETIDDPIKKISQLRGVTYNWKENNQKEVGFIAEEVGKVIPEIVEWETESNYARSMDYTRITPILLEAIKAQQLQIDNLKIEIISLKNTKK